jgi:putative heme iron utilization protein
MMNKPNEQELSELCNAYQTLIASQQTLLLSTVSKNNQPEISYAPYVRDEREVFYIFVSDLASHTDNLRLTKQASILFIKPESETREPFARERITFKCSVSEITSDEAVFDEQLTNLHGKFGQIISVLKSLNDFHLFALKPISGQYVVGFGKAFKIAVTDGSLTMIGKN